MLLRLDLFNNLINATKENEFVQSFMKEVKDCMKENRNDVPVLEQIKGERNMSTVSENKIRNHCKLH